MRYLFGYALGMATIAGLTAASLGIAQTSAPTNSLPNPYRSIENWGTLPAGRAWGSTSAVAIDPDGTSVWVAERCGEVPAAVAGRSRRSRSAATAPSSTRSSSSMPPASC